MRERIAHKLAFPSLRVRRTLLAALLLVGLTLSGLSAPPLIADEGGQAALVIQYDEATVETLCLPLEGESMTGMDLLERSGLNLIVEPGSSMGVTICQIEGVGCDYPAKACFCQCMGGGDCAYWNYFYREPGGGDWVYSALGAVMHKVQPGAVEAWVWGDGTQPPVDGWTYEAICLPPSEALPSEAPPSEAPPTEALPTEAPLPEATAEPVAAAPEQPAATPTAAPVQPTDTAVPATATPAPSPTPEAASGSNLASYGLFAVMALALVGIGLWVKGRQA